jgi:hypothetical protein
MKAKVTANLSGEFLSSLPPFCLFTRFPSPFTEQNTKTLIMLQYSSGLWSEREKY